MAQTRSLPCALCSRSLELREDKNGKPYFVCDECGTQFFIRGATGKERLAQLLRPNKAKGRQFDSAALLNDLDQMQGYIETFYNGELVLPGGDGTGEFIDFSVWTNGVCEKLAEALKRCTQGR